MCIKEYNTLNTFRPCRAPDGSGVRQEMIHLLMTLLSSKSCPDQRMYVIVNCPSLTQTWNRHQVGFASHSVASSEQKIPPLGYCMVWKNLTMLRL